jgi:hypothetical protein
MNNHLDKLQVKLTRELIEVEIKTNNGIHWQTSREYWLPSVELGFVYMPRYQPHLTSSQ